MASTTHVSFRLDEGAFIGSYRVQRPVLSDRWGEVYVAKRTSEHRQVLLRLLPESSGRPGGLSEQAEAIICACSELEHSAVARTTPVQREGNHAFVASDCPGGSSGDVVFLSGLLAGSEGGLPESRVRSIALQLAEALVAGHRFRGTGIACGRLVPELIVMTPQQQPRILHYGTAAALSPDLGLEDDIRQFGVLVYRLISGLPAMDAQRSPSSFGVSRVWDRIVGGCLQAGQEGGYARASDVVAALEQAEAAPVRSTARRLASVAAIVVAVVAVALTVVFALRRRGGESQDSKGGVARPAQVALDLERVAEVRSAIDNNNLDLAETRAKALLSAHPRDETVQGLVAEIASRRALAELEPTKDRALASLSRALDVSPAQGFQAHIDRLQRKAKEAQALLSRMKTAEAAEAYRDLAADAEDLLDADRARTEALGLRETLGDMLDRLDADPELTLAAADSNAVEQARAAAQQALEQGQARVANDAYREVVETLKEVMVLTAARQRADGARSDFQKERETADPVLAGRLRKDVTAAVDALVAKATQATEDGDWTAAETAWREAQARLADALDAAAGKPSGPDGAAAPVTADFTRPQHGNLVLNGGLEQGQNGQPAQWSRMDGLTTSWEAKGKPGHCLVFDTSVQQKDKRALEANPGRPVQRSEGGQYATVGAHEGVWAFAPPVPVTAADKYFVVAADVWGSERSTSLFYPQVLLRGFQPFDPRKDAGTYSWFQTPHEGGPAFSEQFGAAQRRARQGDFLMVWRHALVCRVDEPGTWGHYRLAFKLPDTAAHRPDVLLLKCYAMWPLGEYRFDNVELRAVDEAEYERVSKEGHSIRGFMPLE
jgi:hypothetical protein